MSNKKSIKKAGNDLVVLMIMAVVFLILLVILSAQYGWFSGEWGELQLFIIVAIVMTSIGIYSWRLGKLIRKGRK